MADVWVATNREGRLYDHLPPDSYDLVHADEIRSLSIDRASRTTLVAQTTGLDRPGVALVAMRSDRVGDQLPPDLHLELLAALTAARRKAQHLDEPVVLHADWHEGRGWCWMLYTLHEFRAYAAAKQKRPRG
ncbi:hypothetical protein [Streptomyces sp. NBC_00370]|uniref:hypothetical protein n=1 Tax=Streptomyces sp. NBC_00370 TaxID=2975728 RepID=UPI002E262A7C